MPKEQEETISITRSYAHKLVPENYGIEGHRFAPFDFFASYNHSNIPVKDATPEKIKEISDTLQALATGDVEGAVKSKLDELRDPKDNSALTAKDLDGVSPFVIMLTKGASEEEYTAAITSAKGKLNDNQLNFLRNVLRVLRKNDKN